MRLLLIAVFLILISCGDESYVHKDVYSTSKMYIGGYVGYYPVDVVIEGIQHHMYGLYTTRVGQYVYLYNPPSGSVSIADSVTIEYVTINGDPYNGTAVTLIGSERIPTYVVW